MKNQMLNLLMPLLPKGGLSHWTGKFVHKKLPGALGRKSVEMFANYYNINLAEAEHPLEHYQTIGELFTRKLKNGVRPIGEGILHPADSLISQAGSIEQMKLIQAKGRDYSILEFLKNNEWAKNLEGGTYLTYYLCPTDYHRVHSPVDGKIVWATHVPGEFWPVNEWSVNAIANLFSINERVIVGIETPRGKAVLVMVAATNVGNMKMSFDPSIDTTLRGAHREFREYKYPQALNLKRGDEIGVFHMGSTVVMLYEQGMVPAQVAEQFKGKHVRIGETLTR
jgi:phosphatidylserine decarboxylase